MPVITIDMIDSGTLNLYRNLLTAPPPIVDTMADWGAWHVPFSEEINLPVSVQITSSQYILTDTDVRALNRALFRSVEVLYDIS